jgi:hypothetical protein
MSRFATTIRREHRILAWLLGILLSLTLGAAAGSAASNDDPNFKTANGISVYLGVIPAAIVRGHPQGHPEATMPGGPPRSSSERHVVVALFDSKTFERITDADIIATVEGLGHLGRTTKKLERMDIADAPTFGGYFAFEGRDEFTIRPEIKTPRRTNPTIVEFTYET